MQYYGLYKKYFLERVIKNFYSTMIDKIEKVIKRSKSWI